VKTAERESVPRIAMAMVSVINSQVGVGVKTLSVEQIALRQNARMGAGVMASAKIITANVTKGLPGLIVERKRVR
jgi:adenylosuccinate lyase